MTRLRIAALTTIAVLVVAPAAAFDGSSFVASGTGKVVAKPDIAFVSMNFESKGKTPQSAVARDGETVGKVTKALTDAGVEPRDLQTDTYTINAYDGPDGCGEYHEGQQTVPCVVEGYRIRNSLTVRIRDLSRYPQILEAAIGAGLSDIGGITLGVSDPQPFRDQAYAAALLAAKAKAELTAKTLAFELGPILDIGANIQMPGDDQRPATLQDGLEQDGDGEADLGIAIQPGELTFSRDTTITYQIVQKR